MRSYVYVIASLAAVDEGQVQVTSSFNATNGGGVVFATTVIYPPQLQNMPLAAAFQQKLLAQGNVVLNANLYLAQWGNITVSNVLSGYLPPAPPPPPAPVLAPAQVRSQAFEFHCNACHLQQGSK